MRTCNSCSIARRATRIATLAAVALAGLVVPPPTRAQHGGACEPPHHEEQPAAGHWTGHYRLVYELLIPQMPASMQVLVTWEGELSFDLGRPEGEDDAPAAPPPPPRRRPLGVKPPTSSLPPSMFVDCCNDEQAAAILAPEQQRETANEAEVQKILQWYADNLPPEHLYVLMNFSGANIVTGPGGSARTESVSHGRLLAVLEDRAARVVANLRAFTPSTELYLRS